MSMLRFAKHIVLSLLLSLIYTQVHSQIWTEDFEDESGGDTSGTGSPSGNWTSSCIGCNGGSFEVGSLGGNNYFSAGRLDWAGTGTGNEGVWTSPDISISGFTDVSIYIETSSVLTETGDYLRVYYQLNTGSGFGAETLFHTATNGTTAGSGKSPYLNGTEIRIVVRVFTLNVNEFLTFDNIAVMNTLFSRNTANWGTSGTWSRTALGGSNCSCTPNEYTDVVIGDSDVVTITSASEASQLTIENTGTLTFSGNFGLDVSKSGDVTINSGGQLTNGGNNGAALNFTDNQNHQITNNGTMTIGDMTVTNNSILSPTAITLDGNSVNITDALTISESSTQSVTFNNNVELTIGGATTINNNSDFINNDDVTMSRTAAGALSGSGTWTQGAGSTLDYSGSTLTVTTFEATAAGNTVDYVANGAQTIRATSYNILELSGTGAKTLGGNISISGNWTLNGTSTFSSGTNSVTFNGSSDQTVSDNADFTFYDIIVNNSGGDVIFSSSAIDVTNVLTLTDGGLDLNGNVLTISNDIAGAIVRTSGFVYSETGSINRAMGTNTGSYLFPFGVNSSDYIPFTFNITVAGAGASGAVDVFTYGTGPGNTPYPAGVEDVDGTDGDNSANTVDRFWVISPSGFSSNPTATITFTATASEVGSISNLQAQRWNGEDWNQPLPGQSSGGTDVSVPGVDTFSPWAISGNDETLPVDLMSFEVQPKGVLVELKWETATETNNDYFTIERTSDFETINQIQTIDGKGTTNKSNKYQTFDDRPEPGLNYYRLLQTDFDGTTKAYEWKTANINISDIPILSVSPNPSQGNTINVQILGVANQQITLKLLNHLGQVVNQKAVRLDGSKSTNYAWHQQSFLSRGIYILRSDQLPGLARRIIIE